MVNEYYNEILTAISKHKDFGKRNPIDIGIELGYPEEDIMEMIRGISEASEEEKPGENSNNNEIYFVVNLAQTGEDDVWVISVNIETWKLKKVKKLEGYQWRGGEFDLKNEILVWKNDSFQWEYDSPKDKYLFWMNIITGEQNKLLTDAPINQFKILKTGEILVITTDQIIIWDGKKNKKIYSPEDIYGCQSNKIIEGDDAIYFVSSQYSVYKADAEWNVVKIWDEYEKVYDYSIGVAEYFDNRLSWWCYKEEIHLFSTNEWLYRKFTEGEDRSSRDHQGFYGSRVNVLENEVLEAIHTDNYRLMQDEIWSIDNKHKICDFPRRTSRYSNQGQAVAIKDKDIFIALKKGECAIIKVDLQNEREAVTIPIEV